MPVSIYGDGSISGVSTLSTQLGVVTATTFSGDLTGNVTGNLNSSGVSTFSNGIVVAVGSTAAPSISPSGDSNTGIFFPAPDTVAVSYGGTEVLRVSNGNIGIGTDNVNNIINIQNSSSLNEIQFRGSSYTNVYSNTDNGFDIGINNPSSTASFNILTANSSKFTVDSSGHVTMPYQPCWNVGRSTIQTISNGTATNINFNQSSGNDCFLQGGCTLNTSNGRVTVPVAGKYLLIASIRTEATGASTGTNLQFQRNGTTLQRYYVGTGSANSGGTYMYINPMPYVASASANDYFELYFDSVAGTFDLSAASNTVVRFMGYLIG